MQLARALIATSFIVAVTGCAGSNQSAAPVLPSTSTTSTQQKTLSTQSQAQNASAQPGDGDDHSGPILPQLRHITTIGSTVDPTGNQNPYGIDIAPITSGKLTKGDLVVCNFNNAANTQGTGTTIIALHPVAGSTPIPIANDPSLNGCAAIAIAPNGNIWAAAYSANDNPIFSPSGQLLTTLSDGPWHGPFGQVFALPSKEHSEPANPAFYVPNANDGSIVRVTISPNGTFSFDVIATGFSINHGAPGSILAPSGLAYDTKRDKLYIVDSNTNRLVVFTGASQIPKGGIQVNGNGFSGPSASSAHVVFSGAPLNAPISAAFLPNHDVVLGNTGDNNLIEITPSGKVVGTKNVDNGSVGALFGIVATKGPADETIIYFNDDNDNTVKALSE